MANDNNDSDHDIAAPKEFFFKQRIQRRRLGEVRQLARDQTKQIIEPCGARGKSRLEGNRGERHAEMETLSTNLDEIPLRPHDAVVILHHGGFKVRRSAASASCHVRHDAMPNLW